VKAAVTVLVVVVVASGQSQASWSGFALRQKLQLTGPNWSSAVYKVILVQPSSAAAAEQVFSLLTATFGSQQDQALQDYTESSLMLQFNRCCLFCTPFLHTFREC